MDLIKTKLKDVYLIINKKFEDERGFFFESFNNQKFKKNISCEVNFVQDNHSKSSKNVLRGLHYQIKYPQGKLVRCILGSVYDVVVDLRKTSPTFGQWAGFTLDQNNIQLWIPPGFAHGFYTLTDIAEICYKTTDYYYPEYDRTLIWNDKDLNIDWGNDEELILSEKDKNGKKYVECEKYD